MQLLIRVIREDFNFRGLYHRLAEPWNESHLSLFCQLLFAICSVTSLLSHLESAPLGTAKNCSCFSILAILAFMAILAIPVKSQTIQIRVQAGSGAAF